MLSRRPVRPEALGFAVAALNFSFYAQACESRKERLGNGRVSQQRAGAQIRESREERLFGENREA